MEKDIRRIFSGAINLRLIDAMKIVWMILSLMLSSGITDETSGVVIAIISINLCCASLSLITIQAKEEE